MNRLFKLPEILLATNGVGREKSDHPALPVMIDEIVMAAASGFAAGAGAVRPYLRDADGESTGSVAQYRDLIDELRRKVPDMPVQIGTGGDGETPAAQRAFVQALMPEGVAIPLREMWPHDVPDRAAYGFYQWAAEAGVAVQHILYAPDEVARLVHLTETGAIPSPVQVLFVCPSGAAESLSACLSAADWFAQAPDWAMCVPGKAPMDKLRAARAAGGKVCLGLEYNLHLADGRLAPDNAALVSEFVQSPQD